jgi:hypothetical protein
VMLILLAASFALHPSWLSDWIAQLQLYPSYTALGSPVWIVTSYYLGLGGWAELVVSGTFGLFMLAMWYIELRRGQDERFLWTAVLTLTITHLIAPRTATPHYVVFITPLVFYLAIISRRNHRRGGLWNAFILLLLLVLPWVHFLTTVVGEFEHPSVYLPLPFIMLFVLLWTRRLWWQHSSTTVKSAT